VTRQHLPQDVFILGMATLERFFRRKLHPTDREIYYEAVKDAPRAKWEKVVDYACKRAKTSALPKPGELREWMGLGELLTPAEEALGFRPGTIRGLTVAEYIARVRAGDDLPFPEPWANDLEKTCYLDAPYADPPPTGELSVEARLAWIRKYAEAAAASYERCRPRPAGEAASDGIS
jgi:hypothetical protein